MRIQQCTALLPGFQKNIESYSFSIQKTAQGKIKSNSYNYFSAHETSISCKILINAAKILKKKYILFYFFTIYVLKK